MTLIQNYEIDIANIYENKHTKHNIHVFIDKAIDLMNLIHVPNKKNDAISSYIKKLAELFLFQEALFYVCMNLSNIEKHKNSYTIHPNDEMKKSLRRRLFTFTFDTESYQSDLNFFDIGSKIFFTNSKKEVKKNIIEDLTNLLIDKVFFLQLSYIKNHISKKDIIFLQMLCRFYAILLMTHIAKEKITWDSSLFESYKISREFLQNIKCIYEKASYLNQGFHVYDNKLLINVEADIYSTISQYAKSLNLFSDNFRTQISDAFEKAYVYEYLLKNTSNFYEIFQGINPKQQPYEKIDIDIILRDKFSGHYYFIQVKYTFRERLAYIEEELKLVLKNKNLLQKGIDRLENCKEYLEDSYIQTLLFDLGVTEANKSNTHFILLHNITNFDFTQIDDYSLYEWNSFRNIVQRGKLNRRDSRGNVIAPISFNENLKIENIDNVIDKYFNRTEYSNYTNIWEDFINNPITINHNITSYIR